MGNDRDKISQFFIRRFQFSRALLHPCFKFYIELSNFCFGLFTCSDVAGRRIDHFTGWGRTPFDPSICAVLTAVAVDEIHHGLLRG